MAFLVVNFQKMRGNPHDMAMEAPERSDDDDVSRTSLDETLDLEVQEPPNMQLSWSYKHMYPYVSVFQHDELAESEDDMKILLSLSQLIPSQSMFEASISCS